MLSHLPNPIDRKVRKLPLSMWLALEMFLGTTCAIGLVSFTTFTLVELKIVSLNETRPLSLILFAAACFLCGGVFAVIFSRSSARTLQDILKATEQVAKGDFSARIEARGPDELVEMAAGFNHMVEELGSVEVLRSDFINNFSHEFKTPIVSIRGFSKMLCHEDLSEEERREYLDIIIKETERLAAMSENVLLLTKLEQQSILGVQKRFNVSEQIRLVIVMLDSKWKDKNISFAFDCGEVYLSGNEQLLEQAWVNLLDNAIKFSDEGGTVGIAIHRNQQLTTVSFRNHGRTIRPQDRDRIFDKFYQADNSHTTPGHGLGLSITRRIVELHGGTIRVTASEDGATILTVSLPNG